MMPGLAALPAMDAAPRRDFLQMIQAAGLDTSLDFALDAGASASFPGTGVLWSDLKNSNDFRLGLDAADDGDADQPTFTGVAGNLSANEYFALDSGDFFGEDSNLTFAENWHKDGATFTLAGLFWFNATGSYNLFSTLTAGSPGVQMINSSGSLGIRVRGASGTSALFTGAVTGIGNGSWQFLALSVNENGGAGASRGKRNTTEATFNAAYSSPASTGSGGPYNVCGINNGGAGGACRIACLAGWSRALSSGELGSLYALARNRFKTLP